MASKIVIVLAISAVLALVALVTVACLIKNWSKEQVTGNVSEEDWWCETSRGLPCSENRETITWVNWTTPFLDVSRDIVCMDVEKQTSNTYDYGTVTSYNDRVIDEIHCRLDSVPCISEFKICIKDFKVPPVTLHCKYLKDFHQTENEDTSPGNQDAKCGATGAKNQTYIMDTGFNITKFDFNCEWIRFEKAIPQTEPL